MNMEHVYQCTTQVIMGCQPLRWAGHHRSTLPVDVELAANALGRSFTDFFYPSRLRKAIRCAAQVLHGETDAQPVLPVPGEVFALRKLLPQTADHDFNVHVMDFQPGEYLFVKEVRPTSQRCRCWQCMQCPCLLAWLKS